ncbi:MAG: hypothetical protein ACTHOD_10120 [Motilibacteraceae bacterium]
MPDLPTHSAPDFPDLGGSELDRRLAELARAAGETTRPLGADEVRRRGQRRHTRRVAATTAAGLCAAAVAAGGVVGVLDRDSRTTTPPVATASLSPTPRPTTAADVTETARALLRLEDFDGLLTKAVVASASPTPAAPSVQVEPCSPVLTADGPTPSVEPDARTASGTNVTGTQGLARVQVDQLVIAYTSADAAAKAMLEHGTTLLQDCEQRVAARAGAPTRLDRRDLRDTSISTTADAVAGAVVVSGDPGSVQRFLVAQEGDALLLLRLSSPTSDPGEALAGAVYQAALARLDAATHAPSSTSSSTPTASEAPSTEAPPSGASATTTPSGSQSAQPVPVEKALLPVSALPRPAGFAPWSAEDTSAGAGMFSQDICALAMAPFGDSEWARRYFISSGDQAGEHLVARWPDVATATHYVDVLERQLRECPSAAAAEPSGDLHLSLDDLSPRPGIGDQALLGRVSMDGPTPDAKRVQGIGIVRTGRVISLIVVQLDAQALPPASTFDPFLQAVAERTAPLG